MILFRSFALAVVLVIAVAEGTNHKILQIHGEAGPLDPETAVTFFIITVGLNSLLMNVAPKLMCELYGLKENTQVNQYWVKQCGTGVFSYVLMTFFLFFKKTSIYTAIQAANAVCIYEHIRNILDGDAIKLGFTSANGEKFALAVHIFSMFAMTQDYADTAIKATSVLWGLTGLQAFLAPESAAKAWQFDANKVDVATKIFLRFMGCCGMAHSAFTGSIAFCGATNLQAVGYGSFAWALFCATGVLNGEFNAVGMANTPHLIWFVLYVVLIGTSLL